MKNSTFLSLIAVLSLGVAFTSVKAEPEAKTAAAPATSTTATAGAVLEKANAAKFEKRIEKLKTELSLTPDQETKVRGLLQANAEAVKADTATHEVKSTEHKTFVKENRLKTDADIRALLTPEQQTKFDALKSTHKGRKEAKEAAGTAAVPAPAK